MMMKNIEGLARILKVLGEPNRLDIVLSIGRNSRSVTEIVNLTNLSQALVSFHLKALRTNSIVRTERDGPFVFYTLPDKSLVDLLGDLSRAAAPLEASENHPHHEPKHHPKGFSGAGWRSGREREVL